MEIVAIAIIDRNRVLGDGADQPLKIKADWAHFKRVTMGHVMIVGRRTFEAMGVLPGRTTIVLSRDPSKVELPDGDQDTTTAYSTGDLDTAFAMAEALGEQTCFIVGGGQVYEQALMFCDRIVLTEVDTEVVGDVVFPELGAEWTEISREHCQEADLKFDFVEYCRS
ncbi:MAG: dihydrofolate reductase [Propionibacteriaceae bacterium]